MRTRLRQLQKRGEHIKQVYLLYVSSDLEIAVPEAISDQDGRPFFDIERTIEALFSYPDLSTFRRWVGDGRRLQLVNEQTFLGFATMGNEEKLETFNRRSAMAAQMCVEGQIVRPIDAWGEHIYCIPPIDSEVRISLAVAGELIDYPSQVIRVKWAE